MSGELAGYWKVNATKAVFERKGTLGYTVEKPAVLL